jgi:3-oxo-5alpha-steroid 4-dehydrogenase
MEDRQVLNGIRKWCRKLVSGRASVIPPAVVNDGHSWDLTVDVAVIGFGGAGAAAAIEARDQGAEVAIIERFNGGGSTKISGGIYYAGGGTSIQREAGIADSPENMFNYLAQETGDTVCEATLRQFCEESPANLEWLVQQGVPFQASLCPFKTSYPSNDYYFYYSGNESFAPYSDKATPAPRGHRAHGKGVSGAALFKPLQDSARRKGVDILTQHKALALISDDSGEVLGLQLSMLPRGSLAGWLHRQLYALLIFSRYAAMYAPVISWFMRAILEKLETCFGRPVSLRAKSGVIICSGGFFYNREMVEQYAPKYLPGMPLGTIGDDGSGILIGQSMGAKTGLMGNVSDWRFVNPPQSFIRGILVNSHGQRICNEMLYGAQLAERIMETANGEAWLLIDSSLASQALREIGPGRAMWFQSAAALLYLFMAREKAPTLEKLSRKLGIPHAALAATVDQYNSLSQGDAVDPLGKPAEYLATLGSGPWYALDCRTAGAVRNPSITLGGLCVNESSGEVLAEDGSTIKGLYAAGRSAVGIASHSYVSGLSIAGCIFSGRRAGRHAAKNQKGQTRLIPRNNLS